MDVKIYIAAHKKAEFPHNKIYVPLQVGAAGKEDFGYIRDDTGDHISEKNPYYCELTGLYWIWKNSDTDVTGLVHYRRHFYKKRFSTSWNNILDRECIEKIFLEYDIIVPKYKRILLSSNLGSWKRFHNPNDVEKCRIIVERISPAYLDAFDMVWNRKGLYQCNMLISNKKLFDSYCDWLFSILWELEKETDISGYSNYNQRLYGFMSERLFNVWLLKHSELRLKEMPVYNNEKNAFVQELVECIASIGSELLFFIK